VLVAVVCEWSNASGQIRINFSTVLFLSVTRIVFFLQTMLLCNSRGASIPRLLHSTSNRCKPLRNLSSSCSQSDLISHLEERGLISQATSRDKLVSSLQQSRAVYVGIDPTAEYLHVGHLLPLLSLYHFHLHGHRVIPLIGGATGLVGDPSGRDTERPLSELFKVEHNVNALSTAVLDFFKNAAKYATSRHPELAFQISTMPKVHSNLEWFQGMGLLEFLRTVGVHARVNTMIARESVQTRLASQQGISFTEFTYQLLQAYDFFTLHKNSGCTIQIGGSDQWGNILAGIDLINKVDPLLGPDGAHEEKVFGVTTPLLTTPSGAKFGKSAGNAVALDKRVTSVFDFYQFFLRTPDSHVGKYLKLFTLLPLSRIQDVIQKHGVNPEWRTAQRLLASEVTELVHGEEAVHKAQIVTQLLYEKDLQKIAAKDVLNALQGDPRLRLFSRTELLENPVAKLATTCGLAPSNSAARQLITSKGLYLNNDPVADFRQKIILTDLLDDRFVIVRAGSQRQVVLAIE